MNLFRAENICTAYSGIPVLKGLSFAAEEGCITGILGANGSGKTTLLKTVCGILPHEGSCMLQDIRLEDLNPRRMAQICSYIPQRSGISIEISALDVVLMGFNPALRLLEQPGPAMKQRALSMLDRVGLGEKAHANYLTLSEGQKQLCILARTLISDARLLLLDEPESALDFRYRHRMLGVLRDWIREGSRCALITMHDPQLALEYCDRLLILQDGRIQAALHPGQDALDAMEDALRGIYGSICLRRCTDRSGNSHPVIFPEGGTSA